MKAGAAFPAARPCGSRWPASLCIRTPTFCWSTSRVADALVELARGKTLIVATHDPALAARMGRVVSLGAEAMEKAA